MAVLAAEASGASGCADLLESLNDLWSFGSIATHLITVHEPSVYL
jgi:hypothetical protein